MRCQEINHRTAPARRRGPRTAFSPDRQQVSPRPRTGQRLWNLSPGGSLPQWTRRAQLLAARRIDDTGAVVSLDAEQFRALWGQ